MSKDPVVSLKKVGKVFSNKTILQDISVNIFPGEVVGVIGPNGGGKSTFLKLLAGLVSPSDGELSICGISANQLRSQSAGAIGLVLPEPGFYPLLTAWENLIYFGALFGLSNEQITTKAAPLITKLKLTEMDERISALSTGTRQKLSLIRALLLEPKILLLDEPTANLDPLASQMFFNEMRSRANDGLACVWVTHQLDAAESICDRVLFIDKTIKEEISMDRLKKKNSKLINVWESLENEEGK